MSSSQTISQPETLRSLVYYSRGTRPYSTEELQGILRKSRFNNSRVGVTGMLVYLKGAFFQLLEGPADAVEETYRRIAKDPRHSQVTVVNDTTLAQRHFPQWTMGFPSPNARILSKLGGYSDLKESGSQDLERLKSHGSRIFDVIVRHGKSA